MWFVSTGILCLLIEQFPLTVKVIQSQQCSHQFYLEDTAFSAGSRFQRKIKISEESKQTSTSKRKTDFAVVFLLSCRVGGTERNLQKDAD